MEAGSPPQVVSKSTFVVKVGRYIGRYLGKIDHFHFLPFKPSRQDLPSSRFEIQLNARSKQVKSPITNLDTAPSILAEIVQTK
jgi:hypothetical protein